MSVKVLTACWDHSKATGTLLLVLLALADVADDNGECWPSMAYLGRRCRISVSTARRSIRQLEELGEVVVVIGGGKASTPGGTRSNRYRIVVHVSDEDPVELTDSVNLTESGNPTESGTGERGGRSPVQGGGRSPVTAYPSGRSVSEPSEYAPPSPTPVPRRRDPLFDAVAEACGIDPAELTPTARGAMNRALADLRSVAALPEQVAERAVAYRRTYPRNTLTPTALAKHWPQLTSSQPADVVDEAFDMARRAGR